jgi:hypothetical protein
MIKLFSESNEHYIIKRVHLSTHAVKGVRRNDEADLLPLQKKRLRNLRNLKLDDLTPSDLDGRQNSIEASGVAPDDAAASRLWLSQGPGLLWYTADPYPKKNPMSQH